MTLSDLQKAFGKLTQTAQDAERDFVPNADSEASFNTLVQRERDNSWR